MSSNSSAQQSEIKAWEEDITPCEHTLLLEQVPPHEVKSTGVCRVCLWAASVKSLIDLTYVVPISPQVPLAHNARSTRTSGSA